MHLNHHIFELLPVLFKCGCAPKNPLLDKVSDRKEEPNIPEYELCDGCPCMGVCAYECGVIQFTYKKQTCQRCGCNLTQSDTVALSEKDKNLCDGCPCMGACKPECGVFMYEYKKDKWCQKVSFYVSFSVLSTNEIDSLFKMLSSVAVTRLKIRFNL